MFSFIKSDVELILMNICKIIPTIKKVIAVYYSSHSKQLQSVLISNPLQPQYIEPFEIDNSSTDNFEKMRNETENCTWLSEEELPFCVKKNKIQQLKVFDELKKNILLITIKNPSDGKKDLIFIFLKENPSAFFLSKYESSLTAEHKTIIGTLIYNTILTIMTNANADREVFESYRENTAHIINQLKSKDLELEQYRNTQTSSTLSYALKLLEDISAEKSDITFRFSERAKESIKKFDGQLYDLKKIIENAAAFAQMQHSNNKTDTIIIDYYDLNFSYREKLALSDDNKKIATRHEKTAILLNKLEQACRLLLEKNMELTSKNVGNALSKPVTAAAISDSIKNHSAKIITLFNEYPENWPIIKKYFKPIVNVLTAKPNIQHLQKQA